MSEETSLSPPANSETTAPAVKTPCVPAGVVPGSEYRIPLAGGKLSISPLGVGTWAWGDGLIWDYKDNDDSKKDIIESFEVLVKNGINFLDTAEVYGSGESERIIGNLLATHPECKQNMVIATKFMPYPYLMLYPSCLINHAKESIKRLGVDSIDIYQIHGPVHIRSIETVADALAEAVKQGLIKAAGVSNYSESEVRRMHAALAKHGIPLVSNQIEFSLLRLHPETCGLIKACKELGVAVLAYCPLAMGRLTGKYSAENPPPSKRYFSNFAMEKVDPLVEVLKEIAGTYNRTPAQVALNWVICKGAIPIPGARNAKQAEDNSKALGWRLTDDEVNRLESLGLEGSAGMIWQHG